MLRKNLFRALAISLAALACGATGCVTRTIVGFQDNQKYPLTLLKLSEVKNYYVFKTGELRFQTCIDTGEQLVCKRVCGGENATLQCPLAVGTGYGVYSNIR